METKFTTVATVLDDGSLKIGDVTYKAVSEAATVVAGSNRNGWDFWGVPSGSGSLVSLASLRARLAETKAKGAVPAAPPPPPAPRPAATAPAPSPSRPRTNAARRRSEQEKTTSLADMVTAGYLSPPVQLRASFHGTVLEQPGTA